MFLFKAVEAQIMIVRAAVLFSAMAVACGDRGCQSSESNPTQSQLVLGSIHWDGQGEALDALDEGTFRELARKAFTGLEETPEGAGAMVLSGGLHITDGRGSLVLNASIRIDGLPESIRAGVAAQGSATDSSSARVLVEKGLADVKEALKRLFALVRADEGHLIRALDSAEPDEQVLAAMLLGLKRVKKAVPTLGRLLGDPREQVVEAVADALAEIGDQRAVPYLLGAIHRNDLRSEVRAIEALGRIGGKEAMAYLEMTALGHEVEEVRQISKALLERTRKRTKPGKTHK